MGTSKGYISPTRIPWRKAKAAVTSYVNNSSGGRTPGRAVSEYAAAKVADASNYSVIGNGLAGAARIIGAAGIGNLNDYLRHINREELIGKDAEELFSSILSQNAEEGNSAETQLLLDTIPQVLENLSIVNPDDLGKLNPQDFMAEFLGEFICNDFDRCFDEQIRRHVLPREYDRISEELHGYIKNTIYESKNNLLREIGSFDKLENSDIVRGCIADAYQLFIDVYATEA